MAILLLLPSSPNPPRNPNLENPNPNPKLHSIAKPSASLWNSSRRDFALKTSAAFSVLTLHLSLNLSPASVAFADSAPPRPLLSGIASTKSWFRFFGDGFSIRVPPEFEDVMEPEIEIPCRNLRKKTHILHKKSHAETKDYKAGFSLYGDKAKPKVFGARFASHDGTEVLSVVIRPSNQLKITFLEAKDITDLGSLKDAAKTFVPGGATLYSARTLKIKEVEELRTYYFYEFGIEDQHVVLVAAINSGKAYIAGAAAQQFRWEDDGVKLRSAALSLSVL